MYVFWLLYGVICVENSKVGPDFRIDVTQADPNT